MATLWVIAMVVTGLGGVLACLLTLASCVKHATMRHDLQVRVANLRVTYLAHLKAMELGEDPENLPRDAAGLIAYLQRQGMPKTTEADVEVIEVEESPSRAAA